MLLLHLWPPVPHTLPIPTLPTTLPHWRIHYLSHPPTRFIYSPTPPTCLAFHRTKPFLKLARLTYLPTTPTSPCPLYNTPTRPTHAFVGLCSLFLFFALRSLPVYCYLNAAYKITVPILMSSLLSFKSSWELPALWEVYKLMSLFSNCQWANLLTIDLTYLFSLWVLYRIYVTST